ncbi:hypothetical protein A3850_013195 [Lewinella sp. 4G2]|nr:hypothetical protein A3850_013195 [Lewinella sp. 4G2]
MYWFRLIIAIILTPFFFAATYVWRYTCLQLRDYYGRKSGEQTIDQHLLNAPTNQPSSSIRLWAWLIAYSLMVLLLGWFTTLLYFSFFRNLFS